MPNNWYGNNAKTRATEVEKLQQTPVEYLPPNDTTRTDERCAAGIDSVATLQTLLAEAFEEDADVCLEAADSCSLEELRDIVDLSLWAGQLLLQHGAETQRVEQSIHQLGTALGCDWLDILVSPNAIIVSNSARDEFRTKVRRVVRFGGVNMSLMADVLALIQRVIDGQLDRHQVRQHLQQIDHQPRYYGRWTVAGMIGLACAAFSQLFGGDIYVFCTTFMAAAVAMFIRQELMRHYFNNLLNVTLTAFVAGTLAAAAGSLGFTQQPEIALAASVLLLVPGVPLINSIDDLVHGQIVAGLVRGATGGLVSLSIAVGLTLAIGAQGWTNLWSTLTPPGSLLVDAFWSGLAAIGFAMLFNVPRRALVACALCGAAGHAVRTALIHGTHGLLATIEVATLVAAICIGFVARTLERRSSIPASIYAIPAVIPMVPGTYAFGTMIALLQVAGLLDGVALVAGDVTDVVVLVHVNALKTALICGALAVGLKTPVLLFGRQKPVV
ncbi:MAG: threonine/serine exporter family protein [Planctomycetota bacterium]|nr:threonine/serine exporter family protein [Planctomycetota bacterium]